MKTYAFIQKNRVVEIIHPVVGAEGQYVPIAERFRPEFVAAMVDVTGLSPTPEVGFVYDGAVFFAPAAATAAEVVAFAQTRQLTVLAADYANAVGTSVNYTSKGGVSKLHQADESSVANLSKMLLAFAGGSVPAGFAWLSEDNTAVPFLYSDLQSLADAIGTQAYAAFVHLQQRKAAVRAAMTVADVAGVVW